MQIKINIKIFFFIIIFSITRQIEIYGILMLFAFFHELGHLFAGVCLGFKPHSLSINPLGLAINFKVGPEDYNKKIRNGNILALKKLIIASSGPAVNFLLVFIFSKHGDINFFNISQEFLIYANLLIGLFNLIPIYPLDGGRIVRNLLHIVTGLENTYNYTNMISNISIIILTVFSSIIIVYLKNISIILIIGYLWHLVINENKLYAQKMRIYELINSQN